MVSFEILDHEAATVLRITGAVQSGENEALVAKLAELARTGPRRLVIDAGRVDYVNSRAVGDLTSFYNEMRKAGGEMALAGLQPRVEKILRAVGLAGLVPVFPSSEEAELLWARQRRRPRRSGEGKQ